MQRTFITHSVEETRNLGKRLAKEALSGTLVCLAGDLGAGKTTFAQGFLEGLSATRPYTSPTFVIMKQYELPVPTASGIERIYHADAYRVEAKDFVSLGFAEWCADPKGIVILEWPERVGALLPEKRTEITFRSIGENEREIKLVPSVE